MKIRQVRTKVLALITIVLAMAAVNFKVDGDLAIREEFDSKPLQDSTRAVWSVVSKLKSRSELEQYVSQSEERVESELATRGSKIKSGQRKRIEWNGDVQTPLSIVYIHGFSAGPLEMEPVLGDVAKRLHANSFVTRLKAHALVTGSGQSDGEEFASVRPQDWVRDVEEALAIGHQIGRRVIVVAMSTGVPLVLESLDRRLRLAKLRGASHEVEPKLELASLVFLSSNFELSAFGSSLLSGRFGSLFAKIFVGDYYEFKTENDLHRERWTSRYRSEALHAMMSVVENANRFDFADITVPVLTIYTSKDDVVSSKKIESRSKEFGGPGKLIDWSLARRHELSSAAFDPEKSEALVSLILEGLEKFNVGTGEFENKSGVGR